VKDYGEELFSGTAGHYARYRPPYRSSLVRFLVDRMGLDGTGRLLDLGCGPGQLTLRFADWFEELIGLDPEPEMIQQAVELSRIMRVSNARWLVGRAEELDQQLGQEHLGQFRLVLIAQAFHWMDRSFVLERLHRLVAVGGGVAIIDHRKLPPEPWQLTVREVIQRWLGQKRRAGHTTYEHPDVRYEEIVRQSPFAHMEQHELPAEEVNWTIDELVGFLYSTSYVSRRLLGEDSEAFEQDLRESLRALNPAGEFRERRIASIILALR